MAMTDPAKDFVDPAMSVRDRLYHGLRMLKRDLRHNGRPFFIDEFIHLVDGFEPLDNLENLSPHQICEAYKKQLPESWRNGSD